MFAIAGSFDTYGFECEDVAWQILTFVGVSLDCEDAGSRPTEERIARPARTSTTIQAPGRRRCRLRHPYTAPISARRRRRNDASIPSNEGAHQPNRRPIR